MIVIALIVILIVVFGKSDNETFDNNISATENTSQSMQDDNKTNYDIVNSNLQANLSSWGMACTVNNDLFFSDMESGIYINNKNTK